MDTRSVADKAVQHEGPEHPAPETKPDAGTGPTTAVPTSTPAYASAEEARAVLALEMQEDAPVNAGALLPEAVVQAAMAGADGGVHAAPY
mmetsp:Transcript_29990/g.76371  ORF Transcript_29990/g.76371 Transcript_29990/m.76371 type:complete len:90 (+) Transcript_29990:144-413(+)